MWIRTLGEGNGYGGLVNADNLKEIWISKVVSEIRGVTIDDKVVTLYKGDYLVGAMALVHSCISSGKSLCDLVQFHNETTYEST